MLCCGLLTLIAAGILGLWHRLRRLPRPLLLAGGVMLLASPALALSLAQPATLDRADVIQQAMQSLCGHR